MKDKLQYWLDKDGFLHLTPNYKDKPPIDQTTNGALFTGTYIVLRYRAKLLTIRDVHDFTESLIHLYNPATKEWRNHSISDWNEFSLDNFIGVATALKCCMKFLEKKNFTKSKVYHRCEYYMETIPYFHWQLDHPKDFIYLGFLKSPVLFFPLMWFVSLAMIVSCYQTFKYKNGRAIIKTDGKILAFIRFTATKMPITEYVCTWLIKNKKHKLKENVFTFGSWSDIFIRYFKNVNHPNRNLLRKLNE